MVEMTTPSRLNRGLMVPCLDTKTPIIDDIATVLSYGLHTPPDSAHESRRPSLQCSSCGTPGADTVSYSQHGTPVHQTHLGDETGIHGLPLMNSASFNAASRQLDALLADHGLHDPGLHVPLPETSMLDSGWDQYAANPFAALHSGPLRSNSWAPAGDAPDAFAAQPAWMGPGLPGPMSMSMSIRLRSATDEPNALFDPVGTTFKGFDDDFNMDSIQTPPHYHNPTGSLYQPPEVIVPSQLTPLEPLYHAPTVKYGTPDNSSDDFGSEVVHYPASRLGSSDDMDPPSPLDVVMDAADGEDEDYKLVPSGEGTKHVRKTRASTRNSSMALRKRGNRRLQSEKAPWHSQESNGILFECTGKKFSLDGPPELIKDESAKTEVCHFTPANGVECGRRFERHEHLKRHMLTHGVIRDFHCPYRCELVKHGITRSDNACQHFKTHLVMDTRGRRTHYVDWPTLQKAIRASHSTKKAEQLIRTLQKWIDNGMPPVATRSKAKATRK